MMGPWLRRLLWLERVKAVTHLDVEPAARDEGMERLIKASQGRLAKQLVDYERTSWQVRRELAGNVLKIVAGEHRS